MSTEKKTTCQSILVTCIDFRFQDFLIDFSKKLAPGGFDRVAMAGGIFNLPMVIEQVGISKRLHDIQQAILVNHEDCGAYGKAGTPERHIEDLRAASREISSQFKILVRPYYLHLDGNFESISNS